MKRSTGSWTRFRRLSMLGSTLSMLGFDAVDGRFDEVTVSLVEQREYTEFAFDRLRGEMTVGFATVNANIGRLERKVDWLVDKLGKLA